MIEDGHACPATSNRLKAWALATHILFALIIGIAIVLDPLFHAWTVTRCQSFRSS